MKIFLFAGAGASYELGVPTMEPMVDEFWTYLSGTTLSEDEVKLLQDELKESAKDMEAILQDATNIVNGDDRREDYDLSTDSSFTFKKLLHHAEWFIQNVCRRVDINDAQLLWEPVLELHSAHQITIATSNYDRAIEIAADSVGVELSDGFEPFSDNKISKWNGSDGQYDLDLLKMHGSVDWFRNSDREVIKMRHPVSLYGDMEIHTSNESSLNNCLILPTKEKKKSEKPFYQVDSQMRQAPFNSEIAIFLGTSLRDPDLANLAEACDAQMPTYTISPGEPPSDDISHIQATASEFLISILPTVIYDDIRKDLNELSRKDRDTPAILSSVSAALDENNENRVESINFLIENEVHLDKNKIIRLLEDENPQVRKYSLALVTNSVDVSSLKSKIEEIAKEDSEKSVSEEAKLLLDYWDSSDDKIISK